MVGAGLDTVQVVFAGQGEPVRGNPSIMYSIGPAIVVAPVFFNVTAWVKVWNRGAAPRKAPRVTLTWLVTSVAAPQADPPWLSENAWPATVSVAVRGPPEFAVTV